MTTPLGALLRLLPDDVVIRKVTNGWRIGWLSKGEFVVDVEWLRDPAVLDAASFASSEDLLALAIEDYLRRAIQGKAR